jgi:hypothetical protein
MEDKTLSKEEEREILRTLYLEQIEDFCNVTFDQDDLPGGVGLALNELVKTNPSRYLIQSEKLSDMSKTYGQADGSIPAYIEARLSPYRRIFLVGNKEKRPYSGSKRYKQNS